MKIYCLFRIFNKGSRDKNRYFSHSQLTTQKGKKDAGLSMIPILLINALFDNKDDRMMNHLSRKGMKMKIHA